jgi:hypothetical protein
MSLSVDSINSGDSQLALGQAAECACQRSTGSSMAVTRYIGRYVLGIVRRQNREQYGRGNQEPGLCIGPESAPNPGS